MKRLSRDSWLSIGLFVTLVLVTIAAAISQAQEQQENLPLVSFSSAPDGALALRLWLDELGYPVSDETGSTFHIPEQTSVILVLEPLPGITEGEWEIIDEWLEQGGTLILAGDRWGALLAVRHYGLSLAFMTPAEQNQAATLTAQTPLMASPPLANPVNVQTRAYLQIVDADDADDDDSGDNGSNDDDLDPVTHLAAGTNPVLISWQVGDGRVILSAAPFPFSNAGLKQPGNPQLVANVIAAANRPGVIWFDEWHHGQRTQEASIVGPEQWLRRTPAGRSLLYATGVIFLSLVVRGRLFGRPIPLQKDTARRAPLEHITAIANLNRRAGHRTAVLLQHRRRLKRNLGKRYRINPTLPDDKYVTQLAQFNPDLDAHALRNLLAQLCRKNTSESEMIQLTAQVAVWLKEP